MRPTAPVLQLEENCQLASCRYNLHAERPALTLVQNTMPDPNFPTFGIATPRSYYYSQTCLPNLAVGRLDREESLLSVAAVWTRPHTTAPPSSGSRSATGSIFPNLGFHFSFTPLCKQSTKPAALNFPPGAFPTPRAHRSIEQSRWLS